MNLRPGTAMSFFQMGSMELSRSSREYEICAEEVRG